MTVRRGLLYFGVFLVAAGGVTLLASAGVLDETRVADALAWWPLAVIAIGAGLVLRHTRAALPGGVVAAAVPGLMLGAMFVAVPEIPAFPTPCTDGVTDGATAISREGSFGASAEVDIELSCGDLAVTTAPGTAWSLGGTNGHNRTTEVSESTDALSISSSANRNRWGWNAGPDDWDVTLPTGTQLDVDTEVNAGRGTLDLAGARLGSFGLDHNAGAVTVDLAEATLERLDVTVNAGAATLHLPGSGDTSGRIEANAGSVQVCIPDGTAVRLSSQAALGSVDTEGLVRVDDVLTTPATTTAQAHVDLAVTANVGSVTISAEGDCK